MSKATLCRSHLTLLLSLFLLFIDSYQAWVTNVPTRNLQHRNRPAQCFQLATQPHHSDHAATAATNSSVSPEIRDAKVQQVLQLARRLGPVGSRQSETEQLDLLEAALDLQIWSDPAPTQINLSGIHNLVYSASKGGSSGKLGPFNGKVTKEFIDDKSFTNAVELGPFKIALTASREIKDDTTIQVSFHKTKVYLFGVQLLEKEVGGGGVWKMIFAGEINDQDKRKKLVRIMETPSIFIIEQQL